MLDFGVWDVLPTLSASPPCPGRCSLCSPLCDATLEGSNEVINEHIDQCLAGFESGS